MASLIADEPDLEQREPAEETYSFPLSAQQRGLWFIQQLDPASATFNTPLALRLWGDLNAPALARALSEIHRRHEILRTTYLLTDEEPVQKVHPPRPVRMPQVDLSGLPERDRSEVAFRLRRTECERPVDLENDPVMRVTLLRLSEREYELHLIMHHIANDGWSESVLLRELTVLYEAYRHGRRSPLPDLPIQYADYALWQREWLRDDLIAAQLEYWRGKLGTLSALEMPRDHGAPAKTRWRGEMLRFTLPVELSSELRNLAQREGVTLFVVLLAGFKLLLRRYSGQEDIAVGTIIANRNQKETQDLIGCFVNNLVLRTDLSGPLTFRELVKRVAATTLEAYENQDVPFDRLVKELNPERYGGWMPLVQAVMVFQNTPSAELRLDGLQFEQLPMEYGYSYEHLCLSMHEKSKALAGSLTYSTELFARASMERMLGYFERLLSEVSAAPDRDVDRIPLLSAEERAQVLYEWNATEAEYPKEKCVHELFEEQAERSPEAIAVVYEEQSVSYGELNERANRLARFLRRLGIERESRVGICLERNFGMVESVLGVVKAGGVYVPMDPAYPVERLNFIAKESGCEVVICGASLKSAFERTGYRVIDMEANGEEIRRESAEEFESGVNDANLAYVIYTSGSTGKPKGVMISHGSLSNRVLWEKSTQPPDESDAVLQLASFSFDVSVWELFTPLASGARLVLPGPGERQNPERIAHLIEDHKVTIVGFVPSLLELLLEEPVEVRFASLKRVLSGGDALPLRTLRRFIQRCGAELYNFYGPTESTIDATFWRCRLDDGQTAVPIGRPVGNLQAYVLDSRMNPVPIGVPGQLYIGGAGLARGYQERPDLTAEMFAPNPFSREYGARLYRTGDLARYREDGNIEHLGRMDQQIKIRGFRIELKEIESALRQHPSVREAVVLAEEQERPALPEDSDDMEFFQVDWFNGAFLKGLAADHQDIRQLIEKIDSLSEEEVELALHRTES